VLVPTLAVAFGYRAVVGNDPGGQLDVLRTFPVSRMETVLGVYVGYATALLLVVLIPLLLAGVVVALLGGASSSVFVSHGGADSAFLYLRFVTLTSLYALVVLAIAIAVSTIASTRRSAAVLGIGAVLLVVVGLDLGIIAGLAGGVIPDGALQWLLALSPASAYRGLVFELVVKSVGTSALEGPPPLASAAGLIAWASGSMTLAIRSIWR
jgi:ABC-2 type transport system permease protein